MRNSRRLLRHPRHLALTTIVLAASLWMVVVVASLADALWLRQPPVFEPERLVAILSNENGLGDSSRFRIPFLTELEASPFFEAAAGQALVRGMWASLQPRISFEGGAGTVETIGITPGYFEMLGVSVIGRTFDVADDRYQSEPTVIISHRLWMDRFGGADVLGRTLRASPRPLTLVGIAPPGFHGALRGENADVWLPRGILPALAGVPYQNVQRDDLPLMAFARLRSGKDLAEANSWLAANSPKLRSASTQRIAVPIAQMFGAPESPMVRVGIDPVFIASTVAAAIVLVGGAITLVLFSIAHHERRGAEYSIRNALGSTRLRMIGELILEQAMPWLLGTGAGFALGKLTLRWLPSLRLPAGVELGRLDPSLSWRVVAIGLVASFVLLVIVVAGSIWVARVAAARRVDAGSFSASLLSRRWKQLILASQAAAIIALVTVADSVLRTVSQGLEKADFAVDETVFAGIQTRLPWNSATNPAALELSTAQDLRAAEQLLERVRSLPGVQAVALGRVALGADRDLQLMRIREIEIDQGTVQIASVSHHVTPGFLEAVGIRLVAGREAEAGGSVITTDLADRLWPGEPALGRSFSFGLGDPQTTVSGVVRTWLGATSRGPVPARFQFDYEDFAIKTDARLDFVVRTTTPRETRDAVRGAIESAFPRAPILRLQLGSEVVAEDQGRQRLAAWFFSKFAAILFVLGSLALIALVRQDFRSRRREFGVMAALGATRRAIVWRAVQPQLRSLVLGSAIGLLVASAASFAQLASPVGVPPADLMTIARVCLCVAGVEIAVTLVSAFSAAALSPLVALRSEA